jgi:hypothetical protein
MMNRSTNGDLRGIEAERITWTGEIFLKNIPRRATKMKSVKLVVLGAVAAGALLTLANPAVADSRHSGRRSGLANELRQGRQEIREGRRELHNDLRQLERARREYREDLRDGAGRGELARDRAAIRRSEREVAESRRELRQDLNEYNQDLRRYRNRYDRDDSDRYGWYRRDNWRDRNDRDNNGWWNGWWGWGR